MVLVVDFDGTLVKENSSRLLENLLIKRTRILGLLLLGLGKILRYKGDLRRYIILNFFIKTHGKEDLIKSMKNVAEQLTVREEFKNKEFIVLSSGLKPIIENTIKINNLKALEVYASELIIYDKKVEVKELTLNEKAIMLENLVKKYHHITYITDDIKEAFQLKHYENTKICNISKRTLLENWQISLLRLIIKELKPIPHEILLDVGCGNGWLASITKNLDISYLGLEPSRIRIKKAWKKKQIMSKSTTTGFIIASATHMPIRNSSIPLIVCNHVLEHIQNDYLALDEISRVSKEGGRIFIGVPKHYSRMIPILWPWYKLVDKKLKHLRHYKAENLVTSLNRKGLRCKRVVYTAHVFKALAQFLALFSRRVKHAQSPLWWKLEEMDVKFKNVPVGGHFYIVATKSR